MIASFRHKGLKELFEDGKTAKINKTFHERALRRLDALDAARRPEDVNLPGFNYHQLSGYSPTRYTIHVNGPWSIDFEFDGENATNVDFTNH
jgi:toxin HigB-1